MLAEGMTVKDLADRLETRVKDVLKALLDRRMMMTINSVIDLETARSIAATFGAEIQTRSFEQEIHEESDKTASPEDLVTRWPVVTIMGHVDHGKTTLLDAIRETRVAEREAGGITQHIGAYLVPVGDKKSVVFLDTPGHEAFTMMRARGAKVTDVVILVVAADDGVMPQTREAIDHAKAANVKIIVAVNKIDKPGANPEPVKRQLTELGLMPEEWGGQTVFVEVSAKKKQNLDTLLEMILLVTEMDDFKANPEAQRARHGAGDQARSRSRSGGHGARAGRHAARRRQRHRRPSRGPRARAHRRSRTRARSSPVRRRRSNCWVSKHCRLQAIRSRLSRIRQRRGRSRPSVRVRPRNGRSAPRVRVSPSNRCSSSWPKAA